jgi:hypothetical protein
MCSQGDPLFVFDPGLDARCLCHTSLVFRVGEGDCLSGCGARVVELGSLFDAGHVVSSTNAEISADRPLFAVRGDRGDSLRPRGAACEVCGRRSELSHPRFATLDGYFDEEAGALFDRVVAFGQGEGRVGVCDALCSRDQPDDQVSRSATTPSGRLGPPLETVTQDSSRVFGLVEGPCSHKIGEVSVEVETAGFSLTKRGEQRSSGVAARGGTFDDVAILAARIPPLPG